MDYYVELTKKVLFILKYIYVECGSPESNNINKLYAYNNNNNNIRKVN